MLEENHSRTTYNYLPLHSSLLHHPIRRHMSLPTITSSSARRRRPRPSDAWRPRFDLDCGLPTSAEAHRSRGARTVSAPNPFVWEKVEQHKDNVRAQTLFDTKECSRRIHDVAQAERTALRQFTGAPPRRSAQRGKLRRKVRGTKGVGRSGAQAGNKPGSTAVCGTSDSEDSDDDHALAHQRSWQKSAANHGPGSSKSVGHHRRQSLKTEDDVAARKPSSKSATASASVRRKKTLVKSTQKKTARRLAHRFTDARVVINTSGQQRQEEGLLLRCCPGPEVGREGLLTWLRRELKRKRVGSSRLMGCMDDNRSGTASFNEFAAGLGAVDFDLERDESMRLFKAVDVTGDRSVSMDELKLLLYGNGTTTSTTTVSAPAAALRIPVAVDSG